MTKQSRPQTTIVLAMSADGKIADVTKAGAKFGSKNDKAHFWVVKKHRHQLKVADF